MFDGFNSDERCNATGRIRSFFTIPAETTDVNGVDSVSKDVDEVQPAPVEESEIQPAVADYDRSDAIGDLENLPSAEATQSTRGGTQYAVGMGYDPAVFRALPKFLKHELRMESAAQHKLFDSIGRGAAVGVGEGKDGRGESDVNGNDDADDDDDDDGDDGVSNDDGGEGDCVDNDGGDMRRDADSDHSGGGEGRRGDGAAQSGIQDELPSQWDASMFVDLPHELQKELLDEHRRTNATSRKAKGKRPHQQTVAHTIGAKSKNRRTSVGLFSSDDVEDEDDMIIPTPPVLQTDTFELQRAVHRSDALLFEDEKLSSYSGTLREFIARTAKDVRSAHVEALRSRVLDFVLRHKFIRAAAEMKTIRIFVIEVGGHEWRDAFNVLLDDVQTHMLRIVHSKLAIVPLEPLEEVLSNESPLEALEEVLSNNESPVVVNSPNQKVHRKLVFDPLEPVEEILSIESPVVVNSPKEK